MIPEGRTVVCIEIIRTVSLLCVIFFHAIGMLMSRGVIPSNTSWIVDMSAQLVGVAVSFFFFVSGYLYRRPNKGSRIQFIYGKILRLVVPYCTITLLVMLLEDSFEAIKLYGGEFYHLWFLSALFWCFIFSIWINYSAKTAVVIIPIAMALIYLRLPVFLGIQVFVQWYAFFCTWSIGETSSYN